MSAGHRHPPAAARRARRLGAAVEGLSRFLQDLGAEGDLRRHLGAAARSRRADVRCSAPTVDGKLLGIVHYLYHRSCWTVGDYCYLQDLFVARERAQARARPRADRGGLPGGARGGRKPRALADARDQRHGARALRHAGGSAGLHPVPQGVLTRLRADCGGVPAARCVDARRALCKALLTISNRLRASMTGRFGIGAEDVDASVPRRRALGLRPRLARPARRARRRRARSPSRSGTACRNCWRACWPAAASRSTRSRRSSIRPCGG